MSASKEEMLERINMKIYGLNSSIIQDDWAKHELALWRSIRTLIEHGFPHKCPVCDGHGTVSRPPWVAGDQPEWTTSDTATYPCQACGGTGIIWKAKK